MPVKQQEYEVKLDLFEGPLDLLLYLVNKAEVKIVDISVSKIAHQYLEYLDVMHDLNIDVASEYLHMAAVLIRLKARELLPPQEQEEGLDGEDGIYNREQLIAQLLEYKKFKEAAGTLKVFESEQYGAFVRGKAEEIESGSNEEEINLGSISIFDLLTAFKRILERASTTEEYRHVVEIDSYKIDDRIEHILGSLSETEELRFEELFTGNFRKIALVVTFMAILELVKMQEISFRQEENFGAIFVKRRTQKDPPTVPRDELETEEQLSMLSHDETDEQSRAGEISDTEDLSADDSDDAPSGVESASDEIDEEQDETGQ